MRVLKYNIFFLLITLIFSSCKIFKDDNSESHYDYELGEIFELAADSSIVLKDSTNNEYYTIKFAGPVIENRKHNSECNNGDPWFSSVVVFLEMARENADKIDIKLETYACLSGGSKEIIVYTQSDSLVFIVSGVNPHPDIDKPEITFNEYSILLEISKSTSINKINGTYSGYVEGPSPNSDIVITFTDSTFNDQLSNNYVCSGRFYQAQNELIFEDHCVWDHMIHGDLILSGIVEYCYENEFLIFQRYIADILEIYYLELNK